MFGIFPEIKPFEAALGWTFRVTAADGSNRARLMSRPKLLLLDEPSLGLAPLIVQQFTVIADVRRDGTTVLLVEQNAIWRFRSPTADMCWKRATRRSRKPERCGITRTSGPLSGRRRTQAGDKFLALLTRPHSSPG